MPCGPACSHCAWGKVSRRHASALTGLWLRSQINQDILRFFINRSHDLADPGRVNPGKPFAGLLFFLFGGQHRTEPFQLVLDLLILDEVQGGLRSLPK